MAEGLFHRIRETLLDSFRVGCKDLLELIRDRLMLASFIIMPLFMMLITGYIYPSQRALGEVPLGIINQDTGRLAALIIEPLLDMKSSGGRQAFYLTAISSVDEAVREIKSQQISAAILIPHDFSDKIVHGKQGAVTIITDESNPQLSVLLSSKLDKIISDLSTEAGKEQISKLLPQAPSPEAITHPFTVRTQGIAPGKPNYFQFVAPGVMSMIVIFAVLLGMAASVARERDDGTIDGILVAPVSRFTIVLGKAFSQAVRGLAQAAVVLGLAILLFDVVIQGSFLLVVFLLLLGVFSFVGLGVLVSTLGERQETATAIMAILQFLMLFLSGVFFPIQQMPPVIQGVSKFVPLTYLVQALRKVVILGANVYDVLPEILIMAAFGVVMMVIALKTFSRVMTR